MSFLKFLKNNADDIIDVAAPVISAANPLAGIIVKLVGEGISKIDEISEDDTKRQELALKFAAYLMHIAASLAEAAADGEITEAEFAAIKAELAKFPTS